MTWRVEKSSLGVKAALLCLLALAWTADVVPAADDGSRSSEALWYFAQVERLSNDAAALEEGKPTAKAVRSQRALAELHLAAGHRAAYVRARKQYVAMLQKAFGPEKSVIWLRREAFKHVRRERWKRAEETFEELLSAFPSRPLERLVVDRFWVAETRMRRLQATNTRDRGAWQAVENAFALCIVPDAPASPASTAAHARLGMLRLLRADFERAAAGFNRVSQYPDTREVGRACEAASLWIAWQDAIVRGYGKPEEYRRRAARTIAGLEALTQPWQAVFREAARRINAPGRNNGKEER